MSRQAALRGRWGLALYAALAVIFVIAVAYQVRSLEQAFPQWFGATFVQPPFLLDAEYQPHFILQYPQPNARAAGLRSSDALIAINGVPITSRSIYADMLSASHPGGIMDVSYRRNGEPLERHAGVMLVKRKPDPDLITVLFYAVLPAFCLALGFWVVAVRLQDVRAWLLLGVMLSIATFFNAFPDFWNPPFRTLGSIYLKFQQNSWLVWLFLLGIYFPEPFPKTLRWNWWKWLGWVVLPLWAVFAAAYIVSFVIELHNITAAMPINQFLGRTQLLGLLVASSTVLGFLACIAVKYRIASSVDAKRRLRVLYAGAAVSLLPITVFFTIVRLQGVTEDYLPYSLRIVIYLAFFLLPVTLAYVIVVQRAMDVRVVIRQGLQYTLARGVFLLHGATRRIAVWVDRRFFRDAYNAEQILNDLAEKVRTIVETQPLLETVAQRIADSLHVKQVAVLLDRSGFYRPAHALGFGMLPELAFPSNAATVQVLKSEKKPTRVYFDDPESWIYKTLAMSNEELDQLATLHSELLLPFSVKEDLLGFISLGQKLSEAPYSSTDLRLLSSVAAQTGLALEMVRLTTAMGRELASHERLNRELEIAREVQEHLFPQHFPSISGLDYSGLCRPAREVGGDYYDFLELPAASSALRSAMSPARASAPP